MGLSLSLSSWSERTAIVTGAATGIGASIAHQLAANGVAVTVATLEPGEGGEIVVENILARGGTARLHTGNLATAEGVSNLVDAATRTYGAPDVNAVVSSHVRLPSDR